MSAPTIKPGTVSFWAGGPQAPKGWVIVGRQGKNKLIMFDPNGNEWPLKPPHLV